MQLRQAQGRGLSIRSEGPTYMRVVGQGLDRFGAHVAQRPRVRTGNFALSLEGQQGSYRVRAMLGDVNLDV